MLKSQVVGAIIDFILNMVFIPYFEASAAAAATMVAEFVIMIMQVIALHKENIYVSRTTSFYKIILSTVLAVIASIWVKFAFNNAFVILVISAFLFFSIYYLILLLMKENITVYVTSVAKGMILKALYRE